MAEDRIQQLGEENPIEQSTAEEALKAGLLQAHFSSGEVDSIEGLITDWAGIITAMTLEIEEAAIKDGVALPMSAPMKFAFKFGFVPVSIAIDITGNDSWSEAAVKNIAGAFAGAVASNVAAGALGTLTIAGSGIIATVAGIVGTVAVGYFAAEFVNDAIGVTWKHFVGPKVEGHWNEDDNSAKFTTFGRVSDTLRNDWDSASADDSEGNGVNLKLDDLSRWTLTSSDPEKTLEIKFDSTLNTYEFKNPGADINSFWGIYYSYGDNLNLVQSAFNALKGYGTTEGSAIVEEILRHHEGDFNVVVENSDSHLVHNYYHLTMAEIQQSAFSGDKAALWAIESLSSFVEEDNYPEAAINPDDYSDNYIADRSAFLFYHLNNGNLGADMPSHTADDIDFKDIGLLVDAYAGNGEWDLPGNAHYTFGSDEDDTDITGGRKDDHLYGMGGDDTIKGHGGKDIIEGGAGSDTMYGGSGDDTFIIHGTDEDETAFDTFYGDGEDEDGDTIQGGDLNDTIRVHSLTSVNSIEHIDGGAGENIIAGTGMNDTINLTGIDVQNIKEIRGGDGGDIITGSAADDHIYGEDDNDTLSGGGGENWLYGGEGNDTYIIDSSIAGAVNHIIDPDNSGIIKDQNGTILNGTWQSLGGGLYKHLSTGTTASWNSPFTIHLENGSNIILDEFEEGAFGINLLDEAVDPDAPAEDGITITGDLEPVKFDNDNDDGYHFEYDGNGNIIVTDMAEPGRVDYLYDSAGNDRLSGFDGNDGLYAREGGNDVLDGGSGDDYLQATGNGNDLLIGGTGNDVALAGDGDDKLYGETVLTPEEALANGESDLATGLRGDLLAGQKGRDQLFGTTGNDLIDGGAGADIIYGGAGDDNIYGDIGIYSGSTNWSIVREIREEDGTQAYISNFNSAWWTTPALEDQGDDIIYGGGGNDWISGNGGDDYIDGGSGNDALWGQEGNDTLVGREGDDHLSGDNIAIPTAQHGEDYLDGGGGNDILQGGGKNDILIGGNGNDELTGDSSTADASDGEDYLDGGDGDDILWGGGNDDILIGGNGSDQLAGDNSTPENNDGNDYLDGGADDDVLLGGGRDDILIGGSGDDRLFGDNGDFTGTGNDKLYGGEGNDELQGGSGDDILHGGTGDDRLFGDNGDFTGSGNDELYGDEGNDELVGSSGDDILYGGTGDDRLFGDNGDNSGNGSDTLYGGTGNDLLQGADGDDILHGNEGNDTLYGQNGNDTLHGNTGDDSLYGGDGDDIYYFNKGDGEDIIEDYGGSNTIVFRDVKDASSLLLTPFGESLLINYTENDSILIKGGLSPDSGFSYELENGQIFSHSQILSLLDSHENHTPELSKPLEDQTVTENSPFRFELAADTFSDIDWDDSLTLSASLADGSALPDWILFDPSTGSFSGTPGDDNAGSLDITVIATDSEGVTAEDSFNLLVRSTTLTEGTDGDDQLFGKNGEDSTIHGGAGNDAIYAGSGDDSLYGGAGADILNGEQGVDTAYYTDSDAGVRINLYNGTGTGGYAEGDRLFSIENLSGSGFDDTFIGNYSANSFYGGGGDDVFYTSRAPNDYRGSGFDKLDGGEGRDHVNYSGSRNAVTVSLDSGIAWKKGTKIDVEDTSLESEIQHAIADQSSWVDILTSIEDVTGSQFDDTISGNHKDNSLYGNGGNDILTGNGGADTLDGGRGNDTASYEDSKAAVTVNLATGTGTGGDAQGDTLTSIETLHGSMFNDHLTGDDEDNILRGGGGADGIDGGEGSDTSDYLLSDTAVGIYGFGQLQAESYFC